MKIKEPLIIDNLLTNEDFEYFSNYLKNREKKDSEYDHNFGRYSFHDSEINKFADKITPIARDIFESKTLLPSYSLFAHYEGPKAKLWRHIDDNACTYTIDMCVYQNQTWDLGVRHNNLDSLYTLNPNQALAYYGNDQEHWRESFPNPDSQHVAMVFFHFVEPDHWWFKKGISYLQVIRGQMTEQQWNQQNQQQ